MYGEVTVVHLGDEGRLSGVIDGDLVVRGPVHNPFGVGAHTVCVSRYVIEVIVNIRFIPLEEHELDERQVRVLRKLEKTIVVERLNDDGNACVGASFNRAQVVFVKRVVQIYSHVDAISVKVVVILLNFDVQTDGCVCIDGTGCL